MVVAIQAPLIVYGSDLSQHVLCPVDNLFLMLLVEIDEIVAIASYPYKQVSIIIRMFLWAERNVFVSTTLNWI